MELALRLYVNRVAKARASPYGIRTVPAVRPITSSGEQMTTTLDHEVPRTQTPSDALDPKRFRALAIIALSQLMVVLDASVVIIALPSAQRSLHISTANRQWMLTAYTLAFAVALHRQDST